MKQGIWYYRAGVKAVAVLLTLCLLAAGTLMVVAAVVAVRYGGTAGTVETAQRRVAEYFLKTYDWQIARDYAHFGSVDAAFTEMPFMVTIENKEGLILLSDYDGSACLATTSDDYFFYDYGGNETYVTAILYCPAVEKLTGDSWLEVAVRAVTRWHTHRGWYLAGGGLCWLAVIVGLIYLCCAAARRPEGGDPQCVGLDRIPFDLYVGLCMIMGFIPLYWLTEYAHFSEFGELLALIFVAVWELLLVGGFIVSLAARIKTHTLWHNTVTGYLLRVLRQGLSAVGRHIPAMWKVLLGLGSLTLLEFVLLWANRWEPDNLGVLWFVEKCLLLPLIILIVLGLLRLRRGIRRIADGQVEHQVSTAHLYGELKTTAEDINRISGGLQNAVEQRMRSERFKTELITNVSHDIKTPLTSIINYVDLMEKQGIDDPTLQEYLAIVSRQSARLKKLTEDLVEASKASTGNLTVERAPCHLGILLEQAVGEYTEKAAAAGLTLLLEKPEQTVTVLADGRHLWRVFDNLLNNVCKYALGGTRVYVDLSVQDGTARILFRNISTTPLHVTAEELMERFVRGDAARHTEGSGLGLSIARSLTELQGGSFTLTVDGDLFKAEITLPTI